MSKISKICLLPVHEAGEAMVEEFILVLLVKLRGQLFRNADFLLAEHGEVLGDQGQDLLHRIGVP